MFSSALFAYRVSGCTTGSLLPRECRRQRRLRAERRRSGVVSLRTSRRVSLTYAVSEHELIGQCPTDRVPTFAVEPPAGSIHRTARNGPNVSSDRPRWKIGESPG